MALPPSFTNSFWTADFSLGPLLDKLQAGTVENEELLRFISVRAAPQNPVSLRFTLLIPALPGLIRMLSMIMRDI